MRNDTKKTIFWQGILIIVAVLLTNGAVSEAASPRQNVKEGNLLYQKGDYVASQKKYHEALEKVPESDIVHFNLGTAMYKEGEYRKAMDHFQKVYLSEDDELKGKAYYNSGNAQYKIGISHEEDGDVVLAVPALEKSLSQYERALAIDENDADTKHNYDFVQRELIRIKEIQKQKQQKQQGQKNQQEQGGQSQNAQDQGDQSDQQQQSKQQGQEQEQQEEQGNQQSQQGQEQEQQGDADQQYGQQKSEENKSQQNESAQTRGALQLTKEEARMRLESYQQAEEPQGQLNMHPKRIDTSPVSKDW